MDDLRVPRLRSERGQTSAEYIGLILVVVAIIAAVAASGIGGAVTQGIENAICSIGGKSCEQRGGVANGEDGGGPDADADGVSDERERRLGTNPRDTDSDGDGVLDGQEARAGTNPRDVDTDGDGVEDGDDPVPGEADADGDGLSDGEEVALGSDARRSDSDGDGTADGDEYEQGTDPTQAVAALTDRNRLRPWERVGMSEDEWREFEAAVLDEVNPDGLEGFLFGRPYFAVDLDENGEIVLRQVLENGVGGLVRVITGAGKGLTAAQAGARAASRLPRAIAARLGRLGVLPTTARRVRPPVAPARPGTAFNALDDLGRPTGASATITRDMLGTGTAPSRSIRPPGFQGEAANHGRGHLIARQLGGSGSDPRNLVTLYQNPANTPVMRGFETAVRRAVETGETVRYTVQPIYRGSEAIPRAVTLTARGSNGFRLDVSVLNKGK